MKLLIEQNINSTSFQTSTILIAIYTGKEEWERKKTKIKQWEIDLIIYFNYELLGGLLFKWVSQFHYYATDFSCEINWRLIYLNYSALKYIDISNHLNIHLLLVFENR
jgi:hypothetical protein